MRTRQKLDSLRILQCCLWLLAAGVIAVFIAQISQRFADRHQPLTRTVTVTLAPGETLWDVYRELAPGCVWHDWLVEVKKLNPALRGRFRQLQPSVDVRVPAQVPRNRRGANRGG